MGTAIRWQGRRKTTTQEKWEDRKKTPLKGKKMEFLGEKRPPRPSEGKGKKTIHARM